jgi:hypothetical protein
MMKAGLGSLSMRLRALDPEQQRYTLDVLVAHLKDGEKHEQLHSLFENDQWMSVRYERSGSNYDGFLNDLVLAWQSTRNDAIRQIEKGEPASAIATCIRYALMRTSINSLSANYIPELVIRAVQTGLWLPAQVLSVAGQIPDANQSFAIYLAALRTEKLSISQRTKAIQQGLKTMLKINNITDRAESIAAFAPYLTSKQVKDLFNEFLKSFEGNSRLLAILAPILTTEQFQSGLNIVLQAARKRSRAKALEDLSEFYTGEQLQREVDSVLRNNPAYTRSETLVLAELAPYLTSSQLQQQVDGALKDIYPDSHVLAALAPHLSQEQLQQVLDAVLKPRFRMSIRATFDTPEDGKAIARHVQKILDANINIDKEQSITQVLSCLAPYLATQQLQQGLDAALEINDDGWRTKALGALVPYLTDNEQGHAVQEAMDAVLKIEKVRTKHKMQSHKSSLDLPPDFTADFLRAEMLSALLPYLSPEQLQQGVDVASKIDDPKWRAKASTVLIPFLTGQERTRVLQIGLDATLKIDRGNARAQALAALASYLSGQQLHRALSSAFEINYPDWRAEAFLALVPYLDGEEQARAVQETLDTALTIDDEKSRRKVLEVLMPYLSKELLQHGMNASRNIDDRHWYAEALTTLTPHLAGDERAQAVQEGLTTALEVGNASCTTDLIALIPTLAETEKIRVLQEVLGTALKINDARLRASALVALVPSLLDAAKAQAIQEALNAALKISQEHWRNGVLATLAPYLTREQLERSLNAALEIDQEHVYYADKILAEALAVLVPYLSNEQMQRSLDVTFKRDLKDSHVIALKVLAPYLSEQQLRQALDVVLKIKWEGQRAESLMAIVPYLTGIEKAQAVLEAFDTALELEYHKEVRSEILASLAPYLTAELLQEWFKVTLKIYDFSHAKPLALIAPHLSDQQLQLALNAVVNIHDKKLRAKALAVLMPYLSEQQLQQTLDAVLKIDWQQVRAEALQALVPYLAGEPKAQAVQHALNAISETDGKALSPSFLLPHLSRQHLRQALDAILKIYHPQERISVLLRLLPYLADEEEEKARAVQEGLNTALQVIDWYGSHDGLDDLVPYLSGQQLQQVLNAVLNIDHPYRRVEALVCLAAHLIGKERARVVDEALTAALTIDYEETRSESLATLAPYLSNAQLQIGLRTALEIKDPSSRAKALLALAPYLVGEEKARAIHQGSAAALIARLVPMPAIALENLDTLRLVIVDHLPLYLQHGKREDILRFCAEKSIFTLPILDRTILTTITSHIIEICKHWRWH